MCPPKEVARSQTQGLGLPMPGSYSPGEQHYPPKHPKTPGGSALTTAGQSLRAKGSPCLPLTELQPNHKAARHVPDARHVASTCDSRPPLPCGSDRWRVPRSWGGGWLACFQDSSTLPTQDTPPGGTQKGAASPPPAQMGSGGREGWLQGRALNWESRARLQV